MPGKYLTVLALVIVIMAAVFLFARIAEAAILPMLIGALLLDIIGDLTGK